MRYERCGSEKQRKDVEWLFWELRVALDLRELSQNQRDRSIMLIISHYNL